jgi:HAD superfamily hydrolase (TIGR01549 family)
VSLTLLLDLDDTLLHNHIDEFLPAYLKLLSSELEPYAPSEAMVAQLLSATGKMAANQRPDCTLKQVFEAAFYPPLGLAPEDLQGVLRRFYEEKFPRLQSLTRPKPEAISLVKAAFERGYLVAVATNPLFPRRAIEHRLAWAGLPVEQYPFELVSSYETFHFSKPNPAYFAEFLGRLNWPEGGILMVGDDWKRDIQGASQLGLATYWLGSGRTPTTGNQGASGSGELGELLDWIETSGEDKLLPDYNASSAMLATLRATPAVLDTLCGELAAEAWSAHPQPEEWCPTEILCHLRDVDREVNLARIRRVLDENDPFLSGKDTDPWADERKYICQDGPQALHEFTVARMKLLDLLEAATPEDWGRTARHAILGPTTLKELVRIVAEHDRLHVRQVTGDLFPDSNKP